MDANFVSTVFVLAEACRIRQWPLSQPADSSTPQLSYTTTKRSYSETEYELISNSESDRSLKRPRFNDEDIAIPEMQPLTSIITS